MAKAAEAIVEAGRFVDLRWPSSATLASTILIGGDRQPLRRRPYRVADAALVGHFKIPRVATGEDCTVHDYNFVPTSGDRAILVSGWYSGGTSVADVTNPAAPREIAFAKGFVWGAYWYNGFVYASDILRGVHIYRLVNVALGVTQHLDHLNPQTQELVLR